MHTLSYAVDPTRPPHLFYVLLMVLNGLTNCKCYVISNKLGLRVCYMHACVLAAWPSESISFLRVTPKQCSDKSPTDATLRRAWLKPKVSPSLLGFAQPQPHTVGSGLVPSTVDAPTPSLQRQHILFMFIITPGPLFTACFMDRLAAVWGRYMKPGFTVNTETDPT